MAFVGKLMAVLGSVLLVHAALSTIKYREHLKLMVQDEMTDIPAESLSTEVLVEVVVGVTLCAFGVANFAGNLLAIKGTGKDMNFGSLSSGPDFISFQHRGQHTYRFAEAE
eukprot:GFYU01006974.1.p2 GENE.GFYU01006974.1~~GFYU01006974.1.p2  ORF type:complete len:111 (-),score=17.68 GFYU01006974.1:144-476(-)